MKRLFFKIALIILLLWSSVEIFAVVNQAKAQSLDLWGDQLTEQSYGARLLNSIGLGKNDPRLIAARLIQILLGLLGVLAVVLIMYGGYVWMTAQGDQEKVERARNILKAAVIGLLIILAAFAIATFVINRLLYATGTSGTGGPCQAGDAPRACGCGGFQYCQDNSWTACIGSDCGGLSDKPVACDRDSLTPGCQADQNQCLALGKRCDPNTCFCVNKAGPGEACGSGANQAECNANNQLCDTYLTCEYNNNTCQCSGPPVIEFLSPVGGFCQNAPNNFCAQAADCADNNCNQNQPNGAVGNLVTIFGRYFGAFEPGVSRVEFFAGNDTWVEAALADSLNPNCQVSWTDQQIVVAVPAGVPPAGGPVRITNANGSDASNLAPGPVIPNFLPNAIVRPGLCRLEPDSGSTGDSLTYYGAALQGANPYFGTPLKKLSAASAPFNQATQGSGVAPDSQAGKNTSFAQAGNQAWSNYLYFWKLASGPSGPVIVDIDPNSGPVGQYVTISGSGFGRSQGTGSLRFGQIEADFDFPEMCQANIWSDNQIIVKTPKGLTDGQNYELILTARQTEAISPEKFQFKAKAVLTPGLCKIEPRFGQIGDSFSLWGEYFGSKTAESAARFYLNQEQRGDNLIFSKEKQADKIQTTIPAGAISGPVQVIKTGTPASNGLNLQIGQCQQDADCGTGVCCPANSSASGRCRDSAVDCFGQNAASVYEWEFSVGSDSPCPPDKPERCGDGSCCLTGGCYDPGSGVTTCLLGNSCSGYGADLCLDKFSCPNSPGNCSNNPQVITKSGTCNCSLLGCADCQYEAKLNRCVDKKQNCDLNLSANDSQGQPARQYCALYNNVARWHLDTKLSCPDSFPVKLPNGHCVNPQSSCQLCANNLTCVKNIDGLAVCAVKRPVCPNNFQCLNEVCTRSQGECECCCDKRQNRADRTNSACCAPLTCAYSCGSSAVDLSDDDDRYGYCSGCAKVGATQAEHDAACNCVGTTGKYCDINDAKKPEGICRDCEQIVGAAACSAHQSCCFNNLTNQCQGIAAAGAVNENNIRYCAAYSCQNNCANPVNSLVGQSAYSTIEQCLDKCPISCDADLTQAGCQKSGCPENYLCDAKDCLCKPEGNGPGEPCFDKAKNACSFPCLFKFGCRDVYGLTGSEALPGNSGNDGCRCCCDPAKQNIDAAAADYDICRSVPGSQNKLNCRSNMAPCSGQNRGLCCGCSADSECGDKALFGCSNDTCCRPRPAVELMSPAPEANNVCRNSLISAVFDQEMDEATLTSNIIVAGDFGSQLCPEGTTLLRDLAQNSSHNLLAKIWQQVKQFLAKLLPGIFGSGATAAGNFCAVEGAISSHHISEGQKTKTVAEFSVKQPLAPDTNYYVILKGDKNLNSASGVLSKFGVGLNGQNLSKTDSFNGIVYLAAQIWKFQSGQVICQVEQVAVEPAQHLFQKAHDQYDFAAYALSSDGQKLVTLDGLYSWSWSWETDDAAVATIAAGQTNQIATIEAGKLSDAQTFVWAAAKISADKVNPLSTVGRTKKGKARIILFFCANPWPPVINLNVWPVRWTDSANNCDICYDNEKPRPCRPEECLNNNFALYYCRDQGSNFSSDDLPALELDPAVRGLSYYIWGEVLKDFYFLRAAKISASDWTVQNNKLAPLGNEVLVKLPQALSPAYLYKIYYGQKPGKYDKAAELTNANQVISGLTNNITYYFTLTITAKVSGVESEYAPEQSVLVKDELAPPTVTGFEAEVDVRDPSNRKLIVSWQPNTIDTDHYLIEYGPNQPPAVQVNTQQRSSYTIDNLDNLQIQNYYLRVAAVDGAGLASRTLIKTCVAGCQNVCQCQ